MISQNGKALIIDPGFYYQAEIDRLVQYLGESSLTPVAVLQTHAHIDHIIGIPVVRTLWPELPVYMHPDEKENWRGLPETAAKFGFKMDPIPDVSICLDVVVF